MGDLVLLSIIHVYILAFKQNMILMPQMVVVTKVVDPLISSQSFISDLYNDLE